MNSEELRTRLPKSLLRESRGVLKFFQYRVNNKISTPAQHQERHVIVADPGTKDMFHFCTELGDHIRIDPAVGGQIKSFQRQISRLQGELAKEANDSKEVEQCRKALAEKKDQYVKYLEGLHSNPCLGPNYRKEIKECTDNLSQAISRAKANVTKVDVCKIKLTETQKKRYCMINEGMLKGIESAHLSYHEAIKKYRNLLRSKVDALHFAVKRLAIHYGKKFRFAKVYSNW